MLSPQDLFASQTEIIDRQIGLAIGRHKLRSPEADDFASIVRVRLLEDGCSVLRRFEGRGSLDAYLRVVVERVYLDYRRTCWGTWRPSATARRLGARAIAAERLIVRDRLSPDEAIETLRTSHAVAVSGADLRALLVKLHLQPRRRIVGSEDLSGLPSHDPDPEAGLIDAEDGRAGQALGHVLRSAFSRLAPADRWLVALRFVERLTVAEIARRYCFDQKALYRYLASLLTRLRRELEAQGVSRQDVASRSLDFVTLAWGSGRALSRTGRARLAAKATRRVA